MKSLKMILAAILMSVLFLGNLTANSSDSNTLAESHNSFGFDLMKELRKEDAGKNIFISPTSIALALSMVYNGAGGETKDEMAAALQIKGISIDDLNKASLAFMESFGKLDPRVEILIANSIWPRKGFAIKKDFEISLREFYRAMVIPLDFSDPGSAGIMNKWIEDNTKGKIKDVIQPPIGPNVVLYLINAIYFKGDWKYEFDKKLTKDDTFNLAKGGKKTVQMMSQKRDDFSYLETDDFQAVNLPYGESKRVSIYVFLPKNLESFIENVDAKEFDLWVKQFSDCEGYLMLPKFKIEYGAKDLIPSLKNLGMQRAFSYGADFKGISNAPIFISKVLHKSFIDLNEEGTEAAAVTVVEMMTISAKKTFVMKVDRPFFFVIRDNQTGANLFMGIVEDLGK